MHRYAFAFLATSTFFMRAMETGFSSPAMPLAFFPDTALYAEKNGSLWFGDHKGALQSQLKDVVLYPDSPIFSHKNGVFIWQNYKDLPFLTHIAADGNMLWFNSIGFGAMVTVLPDGSAFIIRSAKGVYFCATDCFEKSSSLLITDTIASKYGIHALSDSSFVMLSTDRESFQIVEKNAAGKWERKKTLRAREIIASWAVIRETQTIFYAKKFEQDCLKAVSLLGVARGCFRLRGNVMSLTMASDGKALTCGTDNGFVQHIDGASAAHPFISKTIVTGSKKAITTIVSVAGFLYAKDADGVLYQLPSDAK